MGHRSRTLSNWERRCRPDQGGTGVLSFTGRLISDQAGADQKDSLDAAFQSAMVL